MRDLSLDDFSSSIGSDFVIEFIDGSLTLKLSEAQALARGVRAGGAFRLAWIGPSSPVLQQAIYAMRHGDETHEIFIVPIASDSGGTTYEALFT